MHISLAGYRKLLTIYFAPQRTSVALLMRRLPCALFAR